MLIKVVTGYTPLPVKHMDRGQFITLGHKMINCCPCPVKAFIDYPLDDCWLYKFVHKQFDGEIYRCIPYHTPAADRFVEPWHRVLSDCVQHQKFEWLALAALDDPYPDVFIWIDFGVLKQHEMTPDVIVQFLLRVAKANIEDVIVPGLREREDHDHDLSWERFGGAVMIVPRTKVFDFLRTIKKQVMRDIDNTGHIFQEGDTMNHIEREGFPIQWYSCWWGATMFSNFPG